MIDFTRAFDSAWERMVIILFRPFDLGKWFVIGFSAFLAGILSFDNGFNVLGDQDNDLAKQSPLHDLPLQEWQGGISHFISSYQTGFVVLASGAVIVMAIAFVVLLVWLGARGQFLLLDNLVRNRAAIAWPWRFYGKAADGVFVVGLICLALAFALSLLVAVPVYVLSLPLFSQTQWPHGIVLTAMSALGCVYGMLVVALAVVVFIFREWGVALMFRNGLTARAAFAESIGLIRRYPGSVILFILLRAALIVGVIVLSILACCFTCCVVAVPYLGTVLLLPVLIYVRCFSLDCLAQFGPAYDVWTVDVPPAAAPPPVSPPPPRG